MQKKNILWLREDFRLEDNPALYEISKKSEKFTIFYIYPCSAYIKYYFNIILLSASLVCSEGDFEVLN